jgi:hypothetical protein
MKTFSSRALVSVFSALVALSIGLSASRASAASSDSSSGDDKYKKKYEEMRDKLAKSEADKIVLINRMKTAALKQISAVTRACEAKLKEVGATASPSPSPSASASPTSETPAAESASGTTLEPTPVSSSLVVKPSS